jgi:tryptophan 7-halogenase
MNGRPLSKVVVVGRDADLWLTANAIGYALAPAGVRVIAVELPSRLDAARISACLPPLEALHAKLNIDESALLRATGGSFSFGQNIVAGCRRVPGRPMGQPNFFHAWGAYGAPIDRSPFFACWLKAVRSGLNSPLQSFCPTAMAAQNGRMLLPDEATTAFGRTDYGYHLQTLAYVGVLKSNSAALGVTVIEAHSVEVVGTPESIDSLRVNSSTRIDGELFIDATGEEARLLGEVMGAREESWRGHFPADRMLTARAPKFTSIPPFAEIRTSPLGWTALHPSQAFTGVLHTFSSALAEDDAALRAATAVAGAPLADAIFHPLRPARRAPVWVGNCIAVGAAACRFDPIHDVALHALQLSVVHLLSWFPIDSDYSAERTEYNRIMGSYHERILDFQCAFYALNPFEGEFWQQARSVAVPPTLAHKVNTFRARGDVAPMEDESFSPESWQVLFTGFGVWPETWPPAIDRIAPQRLRDEFRRIHEFIRTKVLEQPTHDSYLESLRKGTV